MIKQPTPAPVKHSVVVAAPIARAFKVFTEDFGSFKPREHNLLSVPIAETIFERKVGGHVYDRGVDGSECRFARVLAYDPPNRLLLSWDISPRWQIETDLARTSEWEVRFTAEAESCRACCSAPDRGGSRMTAPNLASSSRSSGRR